MGGGHPTEIKIIHLGENCRGKIGGEGYVLEKTSLSPIIERHLEHQMVV